MQICSQNCVLQNKKGRLEIGPALIDFDGPLIKNVQTCSLDAYEQNIQEWKKEYPKLEIFENKLVSPAFINPHTHIAMNFFRGLAKTIESSQKNMIADLFFHVEKNLAPEDVRAFARMGAYENLLNGVGLVWDHYYHGESLAQALVDVGITGVVCPTLQDLSGPAKDDWEKSLAQTLSLDHHKDFEKNGVFAALGPHATDSCSKDLWTQVISLAEKHNIPIHNHHAQTSDEVIEVMQREGCTPTEFLNRLGYYNLSSSCLSVHNIFLSPSDFKILSHAQKTTFCFCPFSSLIFAVPADIKNWEAHGLHWTVATDCVASNDSMNVQKELKYLSNLPIQNFFYEHTDLDFEDRCQRFHTDRAEAWGDGKQFRDYSWLLNKVWAGPGNLHPRMKAGELKEGYLANIVIWDLDDPSIWPSKDLRSLTMGDTSSAIHHMFCAGKAIGQAGAFASSLKQSTQYKDHLQEAKKRYQEVLARSKLI